jgi:hypothetical protein
MHTESGTVVIPHQVTIAGEKNAVLQFDTAPLPPAPTLDPALHVLGAAHAVLWGLDIRPVSAVGGTGILIEDSPGVLVSLCSLHDHQFSVAVENGDDSILWRNEIVVTPAWTTGDVSEAHGIMIINGDRLLIAENDVSGGLFGMWPCDNDGVLLRNHVHENFIGIILCRVPTGSIPLPSGELTGAEFSATHWTASFNEATGNLDAGYMVIDGSNHNTLWRDAASDNGTYDIELVGDSYRFGFLTPTCFDNTVVVGPYPDLLVKDCGLNGTVIGGTQVDITQDPCF